MNSTRKPVIATVENMRKYYKEGMFAWSPDTGEEYSANPGDYFSLPEGKSLLDDNGNPMFLAFRTTLYTVLEYVETPVENHVETPVETPVEIPVLPEKDEHGLCWCNNHYVTESYTHEDWKKRSAL